MSRRNAATAAPGSAFRWASSPSISARSASETSFAAAAALSISFETFRPWCRDAVFGLREYERRVELQSCGERLQRFVGPQVVEQRLALLNLGDGLR